MSATRGVAHRPVIIVGGGPTGLTTALLLAKRGIGSVLIEADARSQQHPAACILNTRTMEIFRELGVEEPIRSRCGPAFDQANIFWVVSMAGRELGRCSALPDDLPAALAASPTHTVSFPQSRLEALLWERVEKSEYIEFHPGHRCTGQAQDEDSVSATILDRESRRSFRLQGSYLIACDGASSGVRKALGVEMVGPVLHHMLGLHFTADLGAFVNHRPGILYWVLNRDVMGVLIAHGLPREWVLFAPYFPPQQTPEGFSKQACRALIHQAVGVADIPDLRLERIGRWTLSGRIADSYRRGRVFLAGDAAHTFPPTGGLGLNTGVQDGHNLAWKLSAVLTGTATPALLDTYESERRPVAVRNRDQSVRNYLRIGELTRVVRLDLERVHKSQGIQRSRWFRLLPIGWQLRAIDVARRTTLKKLAVLDADDELGRRVRTAFRQRIPGQAEHYRFLGIDLGFTYEHGAVVPDGSPKPEAPNPVTDYLPTTWPGARLPHFWVDRNGVRMSIHDVLSPDGYTLLTCSEAKPAWQAGLAAIRPCLPMPISCVSVGKEGNPDVRDRDGAWTRLSEVGDGGAVLVRPDAHVAWRVAELPDSPGQVLNEVLGRLTF